MVRLGLRAGEVAALRLDDLDWHAGEALIHGKGGREDRLPVPVDVGQALVSYLHRRGRFEASRALFLKVLAPAGPLGVNGVKAVVSEACRRAGVPRVGAHRLRHTAATAMLREGASLPEIAQCCATTSSRRPRSTRASIARRCVRWRCRGRDYGHEPVASSLARLSADPPPARV
jgi:integrase